MTNKLHNKTALIFGEDTRSFLTVIRSLYEAGMIVDVVCFSNTSVALQSKYINKVYGLNHQSMTVDSWCSAVEGILSNKHYDIVIPCDERALFPLMDIKDKLNLKTAFAVPDKNIVGPLFNKVETRQTAELCEVTVAKGEHLNLQHFSFEQLTEEFGLPLVLKPTQSYAEEELNKRQSVKIAHNMDDLNDFILQNGDQLCLVESYFSGFGVGVSILAKEGKIKAAFAHARVAEPETGGGSSYRKAIPIEPSMLYACQKFCMELQYTGVAMFEFKFNPKTKDWILIEINARFWGSLPLAVFAGVDFPVMLAHVLLNLHVSDKLTYNHSAYARSFTSDIYAIKSEFDNLRDKSGALTAFKQLSRRLLSFSRLLTGNDTIDSFSWKDQKPFWAEFHDLFKDKLHKLPLVKHHRRNTRIKCFKQALKQPVNKVLFVCYGNIMRSPFAYHLFNKKIEQTALKTVQSDSFGFHQIENRNAKPQCIEMAKNWEVDLSTHKSKWIKQSHLSENTIVIIFDDKNEYFLRSYYPNLTYISLADLIPEHMGYRKEIEDPYDMPSEYLKECYQLIDASLNELITLLSNR
jgi:protein-tyrosine-phosphatase/predicted ATP-grasp superfamily ATP-dependent carboligase